ncbi:Hypothetical predicted protein [Octopus vulgaris]|uniref:Uncharacterized protein n=1 Tax=Octopus vulgaris TaxID=6645 RepID=A0AA36AVC3_OCTVU|nr:Hypothetical predicted protein [Octopus vulgaris]
MEQLWSKLQKKITCDSDIESGEKRNALVPPPIQFYYHFADVLIYNTLSAKATIVYNIWVFSVFMIF